VNYGYGYFGVGFVGGEWRHGVFFYNREVVHVGRGFTHVYADRDVIASRHIDLPHQEIGRQFVSERIEHTRPVAPALRSFPAPHAATPERSYHLSETHHGRG
jgi:hypothetical protein